MEMNDEIFLAESPREFLKKSEITTLDINQEVKSQPKVNAKIDILKQTFFEFSQRTNVDCYSKIFDYDHFFIKLIWIIIFLASLSFTSYLLTSNFIAYLTYGISTQIGSYYSIPADFPAVTFCDSNAFTTWEAADLISQYYHGWESYNSILVFAYMEASNPSYGDEKRKKLGLSLDQIDKCTFNNLDCKNDLHWYWSYDYGNCYQFNTGLNWTDNEIEIRQTSVEGPIYGLQIHIFPFNNYNWYSRINDFGIVVFVHNSSLKPTSSDIVYLEPGKSSYIQVKRSYVSNFPAPYTSCNDLTTYSSPLYDFIVKSLNKTYRQRDCFDLCIQQIIISKCNCSHSGFDNPYENSTSQPCLTLNEYDCYNKMISNFDPIPCESASCPLECERVEYDLYVSSLIQPTFERYWGECNPNHWIQECQKNPSISYDEYRTLYVTFNVFYSSLSYTQIDVTPAMTIFDLLANIGGSMSLIISVSFFTIFEIAELVFLMVHALFLKKTNIASL